MKEEVKNKYSEIAVLNQTCGTSCCGKSDELIDFTKMNDDYSGLDGYVSDADLGLGCGIPVEFADIQKGATVLDLGSGAGNDVFVARHIVGKSGKVIGLDFTDEMIIKAKLNNEKLGFSNVEFIKGDIEEIPLQENSIDTVISNCVLNLVPDKNKAFSEIFRVLKPNGNFCISDIVIDGKLPDKLKSVASLYTGCVSGAVEINDYLKIIADNNFKETEIVKKKMINIPDNYLAEHLTEDEFAEYKESDTEILSITIIAKK